jgi:hypothetical protein
MQKIKKLRIHKVNRKSLFFKYINLKQELEESIKKIFEIYDQFHKNKPQLDLDDFNHFQEMRFKIDENREELKKRIDDIALEMIDKITNKKKNYLHSMILNQLKTN